MKVLVTGGYGFLGNAVTEELERRKHTVDRFRSVEYDLTNLADACDMVYDTQPDSVVHVAARVGGIELNKAKPATLFYDNMRMGMNVIEAVRRYDRHVHTTLIGTACSYPDKPPEYPITEDALWQGRPAEDTRAYAVAKLALFEMADAFATQYRMPFAQIIPSNLYGPGDNYYVSGSHVIPSLILKFSLARHERKVVELFGDGRATRDFLYIKDAARGIANAVERRFHGSPINLGSGRETPIGYVAAILHDEFDVPYKFTGEGPVGTQRRMLSYKRASHRSHLGWTPKVEFEAGLRHTVEEFRGAKTGGAKWT